MSILNNKWVGWADRSYQQIKRSILNRLPSHAPEITDFSESNPFIILLDIFAGMAEVLHLYIDAMGRELYLPKAKKYTSLLAWANTLDYRPKAKLPAQVEVVFTLTDTDGNATPYLGGTINIPQYTQVRSQSSSTSFLTLSPLKITPGYTQATVSATQEVKVTGIVLDVVTSGIALQQIKLPQDYCHNTLLLSIAGEIYREYSSFSFMGLKTKGFIVEVLEDGFPYLIFGDNINGLIPPIGEGITASYSTTDGSLGVLAPGRINEVVSSIGLPSGYALTVTNPDYSHSGADTEGIEEIRRGASRNMSTKGRAVSYMDYNNLLLLAPGVGQGIITYCCADEILGYITAKTRGIASVGLRNKTKEYMEANSISGRQVVIKAAGILRVYFEATINAAPGYTDIQAYGEIVEELDLELGYNLLKINGTMGHSDIVGFIEALPSIDNLTVTRIYAEPYATPLNSNIPLLIDWGQIRNAGSAIDYRLVYVNNSTAQVSPYFEIYKNNLYYSSVGINTTYTDGSLISFRPIYSELYENGQEWAFRVYPSYPETGPSFAITATDNTIPMVDIDRANVNSNNQPTLFGNLTINTSAIGNPYIKPTC